MANNYYNFGGPFIPNTKVRSGQVNPEFEGVESGFDLLPSASDALTRGVAELGIDVQGGTVNEYDVAMPDTRLTNQEGDLVVFRATHTNDGPVVINVDTIGDIAAVEFDGSAFAGGEIVTGRVYEFRYDNANTQFVLSQSTDAANQAISAEDWAIRPEDDPVPVSSGGDGATTFSALHWSAKSAAFGGGLDFAGTHDGTSGDPASPATGNPLYRIITGSGVITGAGTVEVGDDIYWNGVDWNRINNQAQSATTQGTSSDDPTSPGTFDAQFQWQNSLGNPLADVGFNTDIDFSLINRVHGGSVILQAEDSLGVVRNLAVMQPDSNGTQFYHNAAVASNIFLSSQNFGIEVRPLVTQTNVDVEFLHGNLDFVGEIFVSNAEMFIEAGFDIEAKVSISATDTALNLVVMADFDAQTGASRLAHSDALGTATFVAQTVAAAAGGLQANNTLTGAGFERVLTTGDLGGSSASGVSPFDILSGAAADVVLTLTENLTLSATLQHTVSSDITLLRNEVDSGHVQIRGRNSTSGDALMAEFDPDGISALYFDEAIRIRAASSGTELIGPSADRSVVRFFGSGGSTLVGLLAIGGGSTNSLSGVANATNNGQPFQIDFPDAGGTNRIGLRYDPDDSMDLYHIGIRAARTQLDAFRLIPTGTANLGKFQIAGLLDVGIQANLGFDGTANLEIRNLVNAGHVELRGDTTAGTETLLALFDPDGSSDLYHLGLLRAYTGLEAWLLHSEVTDAPSTGLSQEGSFILENVNSLEAARFGFLGTTTVLRLRSSVVSGIIQIEGLDSGSGQATMLQGNPDGATSLFHAVDNAATARTLAIASGGLEANNTLTGAGFERVLTQSDDAVTATTTELEDIADAINTAARKVAGFRVFNTTTSIPVWAVGAADGDVWVDATGATDHTPS